MRVADVSRGWVVGDYVRAVADWECGGFDGEVWLEKVLAAVERYRVSHLWVVPPIILALAKQSVVKKYDLSSLKQIGSGAAPLDKDLMEECIRNVPNTVVMQVIKLSKSLSN